MPTEQQTEIYRQHRTAQDKYVYFLLAASGAAIAFAVNQTKTAVLGCPQVPLGCAVVLWGLSFFFGCRQLSYVESTLFANMALLKVESGTHPDIGRNGEAMIIASQGIRSAIETNSNRAAWFARWQFRCLLLGAVCYIVWHVYEMWLRSLVPS